MLQSIRQISQSWVFKGLMLFLIVSFCLWGVGDIFRGNAMQKAVATVGGEKITVQQANQLFEQELMLARKQDPNLTSQQARQAGLFDKTIRFEVMRQLVDLDLKRQGISVGPEAFMKVLTEQPQFRAKDGSFNKALFMQMLDRQRISEAAFFAQGQQDLSRQLLLTSIGGGSALPQTMVDTLYKARAQKRVLDVVTLDSSKITGVPSPDGDALAAFYEAHLSLFSAPEYRAITVAVLTPDAVKKGVSVSSEQVQQRYADKKDQLMKPERRNILHVVVQDEAKAGELATKARASKDLAAVAKQMKENAIPMDEAEKGHLMTELSKAVFSLAEGDISEPVKSQLGWHVVQLKKIVPEGVPSLEKVKDTLREEIIEEQSIADITRLVSKLDDEIAAGNSLDDIADGLRLRLVKIPAIDVNGMQPDGKAPTELPFKERVLKLAYSMEDGEASSVEDDKSGAFFVVRTDSVTPAGARPFDVVKPKVAEAWKAEQQKQKAKERAEIISNKLQQGAALTSFVGEEGVTIRVSETLNLLGDTDKALPGLLVNQAFRMKKGETAADEADGKVYVVRLASVTDVDPTVKDVRKNKVANDFKSNRANEHIDQYILHLHKVFPVKLNQALLTAMKNRE